MMEVRVENIEIQILFRDHLNGFVSTHRLLPLLNGFNSTPPDSLLFWATKSPSIIHPKSADLLHFCPIFYFIIIELCKAIAYNAPKNFILRTSRRKINK